MIKQSVDLNVMKLIQIYFKIQMIQMLKGIIQSFFPDEIITAKKKAKFMMN